MCRNENKVSVAALLVLLSAQEVIPVWITGMILFRELSITLIRLRVLKYGVIPASRGGKAKTLSQTAAVLLFLLPLPTGWEQLANLFLWLALVLTVGTGVDYVARALRLVRAQRERTA